MFLFLSLFVVLFFFISSLPLPFALFYFLFLSLFLSSARLSEDVGSKYIRNLGKHFSNFIASYPRNVMGTEVFRAVSVTFVVIWTMTSCSFMGGYRRFGVIFIVISVYILSFTKLQRFERSIRIRHALCYSTREALKCVER
jgi:hypothetical protein